MRTQISEYKYNPYTTSSEVKTILHGKGYSHLFNWNDFEEFKRRTKKAFNQAVKIADLFLENADTPSDFAEYTF